MIYNWKAKYGGMESNDLKRIKVLEEDNRKLKHICAELALDNKVLKDILGKSFKAHRKACTSVTSPTDIWSKTGSGLQSNGSV